MTIRNMPGVEELTDYPLTGGHRLTDGAHAKGCFVSPTVFDRVTTSMRLFQEEIFGPVLAVCRVPDYAAAVEAANAVRYGLASSIYTRDLTPAMRFVDRSEVGIVHVNQPTVGGEAHLPFGGCAVPGVAAAVHRAQAGRHADTGLSKVDRCDRQK